MSTKAWYQLIGGTAGFGLLLIVVGLFFWGRPTGAVNGRVTYKGKPLYTGAVILVNKNGVTATGAIEPDGSYSVAKAPTGEVFVGVVSKDPVYLHRVGQLKSSRAPIPASALTASPLDRKKWFPIPRQYEEPTSSGMVLTIEKGDNRHDIALVD